jgi:hypothetical protein
MSYTSAEQLRLHLVTPYSVSSRVSNQQVIMDVSAEVRFFNGGVDAGTVRVKSIRTNNLNLTSVTLTAGTAQFSPAPVVGGSVVAADNSSLRTVYTENVDYIVDYELGTIANKNGGGITDTQTLAIWYLPFTLLLNGVDYSLSAGDGSVRPLSSGSIASGETVFIDYSPQFATIDNAVLTAAALEANALVEAEVDPDKALTGDAVVQAAAAYRALDIVCRTAAARELARQTGNDSASLMWMKLADSYAVRGERLLRVFRPAVTGPNSPTKG